MASNYSYFLTAGFLDDMGEEEDILEAVFETAADEVTPSSAVLYNCIECKKPYKTLWGYERHMKVRPKIYIGLFPPCRVTKNNLISIFFRIFCMFSESFIRT